MKNMIRIVLMAAIALACVPCVKAGEDVENRIDRLEQRVDKQTELLERILSKLGDEPAATVAAPGDSSKAVPSAAPKKSPGSGQQAASFSPQEFTPGWVARIYDMPQGTDVASDLPSVVLGHFNMEKSGYALREAPEKIGLPLSGCFMWRGEGYILVTGDGGPHTFALTFKTSCGSTSSNIWTALYVGGKKIIEKGARCGGQVLVGGVELAPGLHPVELRFVGGVAGDLRAFHMYNGSTSFELSIKAPDDSSPRPGIDYLLRKKR